MTTIRTTLAASASFGLALLAAAPLATSAQALDRRVRIYNNTGYAITQLYGSNRDARTWEEDILGWDVLPSGSSVVVNYDDGSGYCIFDFRAVFEDGDEAVKRGINVCRISEFHFNP